ncbi:transcriptional corepressor SEUSS-like [Dorcoceras hygrometricum]|uniref:Transcriptional corepressor SEUSS-like n=1 Tax=Dorcoceras hygrometricum TaxID=472368 RepID=A0A2Z7CJL1_9LAMI|nr:transcriptional corepressor SEUSS-like [Dorcoceras hygrometricum]
MAQSSFSSGIFFEGDGPSGVVGNSQLSSNSGNSLNALPGHAHGIMDQVSGDASKTFLNSMASSAPSVGASSLVTDANSGLSGGPHLQRSASINTESYMRLPASPMSFTSNNISISGSSVMDGSSTMQRNSNSDPASQVQQSQQHQGASSATSLPTSRMGLVQFPGGQRVPSSFFQDPTNISQLLKKPRLDSKQEDILQQQVLQQLMHRQDPIQFQNPNLQLQALMQQQRLRQQQLLPSLSPMQRAQFLQQQQQQQQQMLLKQHLQQQGVQAASGIKRPYDGGVCSRRLMQYLYHQRQRPTENTITYWRKFVAEYYSPRAKKRWCLSLYDNIRHHSPGVFPQAATDTWHCDICGSKSGRGFEATSEVFPRLNEIKFGSGVIDELLFLDFPRENRFPSGIMMLEYAKAVQESVYEQFRVVSEGQLRIIFTPDLKILSWEFCARRHEELIPRRLVAPQVNQLLQVAQKCHDTISESGPNGISLPDLQANSAMIVTTGRQLARSLELQSLNDLGFSKRYIAEVVNSMKDLMGFCREQKVGAIDGLKNFPRRAILSNVQLQEVEMMGGLQDRPTDNKLMVLHTGINSLANNNPLMVADRALSGSEQAALSSSNYENLLMRQNSINSTHNSMQLEGSSPFSISGQPSSSTPKPSIILPGTLQSPPVSGIISGQVPQQGSSLQQQMFQQLLQDMNNNKNNKSAVGHPPSRSNSFRDASNGESFLSAHNVGISQTASELPQNLHSSTGITQDYVPEFSVNDFFNNDFDDNMNFGWKI